MNIFEFTKTVIFPLAVIFLVPFLIVRGIRFYKDKRLMKKIDISVKKKLLANIGDTSISESTLRLVRGYILKQHIFTAAVFELIFIIALIVCGWDIAFLYVMTGIAVFSAVAAAFRLALISGIRDLKKIMGFICRKGNYGITVIYYDMKVLKYRMFTVGTVFERSDNIRLGSFINLIASDNIFGTHIIRLLIF